ncbi:hypothetical protein Q427_32670 [Halomonas sp. BC04]|nr:hypothetical protein Q427_32670 [Halomonas sp. BC04]
MYQVDTHQATTSPTGREAAAGHPGLNRHLWMPFSSNRDFHANPRMITAAEGRYFIDDKGRRLFDSLSGLWTSGAGHNRVEIQQAVSRQLGSLDFAPGFQVAHPLAFELAEKVASLTPAGLDHVFFTNSGSDAADTAVKMAKAYWRLKGRPEKTRLIGRAKGYHGVNVGGTSLGGIGGNRKHYGQLLDVTHLPIPCSLTSPSPAARPRAAPNSPMPCSTRSPCTMPPISPR